MNKGFRSIEQCQGFEIVTSRGIEKWNAIDMYKRYNTIYFLLESDKYGEDVPGIIINHQGRIQEWDWYDTLPEWIEENFTI